MGVVPLGSRRHPTEALEVAVLTERMRLGFGVDLMIDRVAAGLVAAGHRVTVFTCFDDGTYHDRPYQIVPLPVPSHHDALRYDLRAWTAALGSGLLDTAYDVWFVATPPFFSLLPILPGARVAIDCGVSDWSGMTRRRRVNARMTEMLQRRGYFRSADSIVVISNWLRDQLPPQLRAKATTIHLGADHLTVAPPTDVAAARERLGVATGEVLCVYVGRLNPHDQPYKGTARLLAMFEDITRRSPQVRLLLVGFGSSDDAAWVTAHGALAIPNLAAADLPAVLGAADVYVTASRWEGFNLPLVEAQRAGVPVVAFRAGAHDEVVDEGRSGWLVASEAEFIDAVVRFADDQELRAAAGGSAAEFARRFTWSATVERFAALLTGEAVVQADASQAR